MTTRQSRSGRILEIGEGGLFGWAMPERTDVYYTSYRPDFRAGRQYLGIRSLWRIFRAVRRDEYALIALHPPTYAGWHPRSFLAGLKYSLLKGRVSETYGALLSPLLFQLLRFLKHPRIVAIERSDVFGLPPHQFFLLDTAAAFFKRELTVDRWRLFYRTGHRNLPGRTFRTKKRWVRRMAKLRPIGIGLMSDHAAQAAAAYGAEKTADVFFAGTWEGNSTVRLAVPAILEALRAAGVHVDQPKGFVPRDEFLRRCASAWITLSPEGLGWDCFRHIEAALAGSVPLVNVPTIERYRPLVIGEHCLAYVPDENRVVEIVTQALADKDKLRAMATVAHQHALAHLTDRAMAEAILEEFSGN